MSSSAQVWLPPDAMSRTPVDSPVTAVGVACVVVNVLLPTWPEEPRPQHSAAPAVVTAHAWLLPALTTAAFAIPVTAVGAADVAGVALLRPN